MLLLGKAKRVSVETLLQTINNSARQCLEAGFCTIVLQGSIRKQNGGTGKKGGLHFTDNFKPFTGQQGNPMLLLQTLTLPVDMLVCVCLYTHSNI